MSVLFVALPIALLLGGAAVIACVRCISGGQYDDLETPSVRMLIDDRPLDETADTDETPIKS
ncbi:Cytochrome oxidase maturation protein cbb3-type [Rubripirellula obstinata]|uniref:Cytochrome oxidase maturation protein cbb3-type n=1 Tax=Rubripirellula obstinata TaxID=406547 RepID=A0A5B1CCQ6_9BACT|nr:cbb3-type cytochrome oxidase assembly protein CcoS [Rubripirellula obstinata]KAA1258917.1 Cytochrome oxidase maturation protein cbb3-type [Rubripirellula obstinata]